MGSLTVVLTIRPTLPGHGQQDNLIQKIQISNFTLLRRLADEGLFIHLFEAHLSIGSAALVSFLRFDPDRVEGYAKVRSYLSLANFVSSRPRNLPRTMRWCFSAVVIFAWPRRA